MTEPFVRDWDDLRSGFMQLKAEPAGRLTAIWTSLPEPGTWRLNTWEPRDSSAIKERFTWHASEAAALQGHQGDEDDALSYWLDQVRRHAPKQYVKRIVAGGGLAKRINFTRLRSWIYAVYRQSSAGSARLMRSGLV